MEEMCKFIYAKDLTDRLRTRSMLCQIYHQALHDRWYQARDLMLMSHLQDTIQHSDVPTQVRCYKLRYFQNQDEQWDISYVHGMKYFLQFEQMPSYLRKKASDVSLFFD